MKFRKYFYYFILFQITYAKFDDNYLLFVISLDGFRYDYLDKYSNSDGFLNKFAKSGFRASWSESIFPSNTYPNHWSMVTGLHAEHHGILNNDVYDSHSEEHFRMAKDNEDSVGWFKYGEPVWIKNQIFNKNKHSIVFDWPGAPASFNNLQPKVYRQIKYENWFINTFNDTIDKLVNSIERGKTNLVFLYLGEPDMAGHFYGPESIEVENTVKEIDYVLENLFNLLKLKKNYDLENDIDILIVTDHGMTTIREKNEDPLKRHVFLSDFIDVQKYIKLEKSSYGSLAELWLKNDNDIELVYNKLKENLENNKKIKEIYLKKEIPERFNFNKHHRTAPIVILAQPGYQIMYEKNSPHKYSVNKYHGNHGYEPNNEEMRGTFLAKGKSFKKSHKSTKPVFLIDYYSLICHLLKLQPNENNGTFTRISHVLAENMIANNDDDLMQTLLTFGIIFIIFLLFISFIMPSFLIFSSVKLTCDTPPNDIKLLTNQVQNNKNSKKIK